MRTFIEVLRDNAVYTDHAHTFVRDGRQRDARVVSRICGGSPASARIAFTRSACAKATGSRSSCPSPNAFVLAFMGALTAGLIPVPMYPPLTLAKMEAYGETVRHILAASGAKALITVPGLGAHVARAAGGRGRRTGRRADPRRRARGRADDPAASTLRRERPTTWPSCSSPRAARRKPKGVMVTHRNLAVNAHCDHVRRSARHAA